MCRPNSKSAQQQSMLIDNITRATMQVLNDEGLINFRVGRIISNANCSSKSFYQAYEDKSDLLLCLWVRTAVSNQLATIEQHQQQLNDLSCLLLPFVMTLYRSSEYPIAMHAISTSINASIWSSVDSGKSDKVRARINFFWRWVRHYAERLQQHGQLQCSEQQLHLLCDKLSYLLRGFIWVNGSQLVDAQHRLNKPQIFMDLMASELLPLGISQAQLEHAAIIASNYALHSQQRQRHISCQQCQQLTEMCKQRQLP
ncbi:hypothetical protein [Ferrimonas senticii]|uniref:hypothetical protein n=1 Tax=Ferrimonas senticii TaxID=394566 RepID=UPI0004281245|nr:hypothetical protein [Ferrimonas senticii]